MSLSSQILDLATNIGTDVKNINTKIGNVGLLNTTANTNLVAAINELHAATAATVINDEATNTSTTWSSSKVAAEIAALVGGAPAQLDALNELAAALGNDASFAATMTATLANKVDVSVAQTFNTTQQTQARANISALGVDELGDVIGTDYLAAYNAAKA
jgi:hypothetical protein